jgi:hypothetical protein
MARIREAEAAVAAGDVTSEDEIAELMARRRERERRAE